jgi:hypothetical protein
MIDKLEIKQGSFIQQTQYFIPVEIMTLWLMSKCMLICWLKQASTLTFVRLSVTSENWRRTSRSCITVVWRDKWKNQIPKRVGTSLRRTNLALTFLVELVSTTCCKSVLSKIIGYRSMLMDILFTFPGNYCIGEGTTTFKASWIQFTLVNIQLPLRWACYSRTKLRNWRLDTHTMMASLNTNDFMTYV